MPSGITAPLYDGESMSFPEFAARTARWVAPWSVYERDASLDTPLPDGFEQFSDYDEKRFREDSLELARVASWSPEEADQQAHLHNLRALKEHLQMIRSSRVRARAYTYMCAQVVAWQAPTAEHEGMRKKMQEQLDETFGFDINIVNDPAPAKITGEELKDIRMRGLARRVLEAGGRIEKSRLQVEVFSVFAKDFKDSLEGWVDVPLPRRVLP